MKSESPQKFLRALRNVTINLVAFSMIVFALADVSILQAYHGNEAIGIPAEHHAAQELECLDETAYSKTDSSQESSISRHGDQHEPDGDCSGETECLAGCCHTIVGYYIFNNHAFHEILPNKNSIAREDTQPKSESADIFHPPQLA